MHLCLFTIIDVKSHVQNRKLLRLLDAPRCYCDPHIKTVQNEEQKDEQLSSVKVFVFSLHFGEAKNKRQQ